MKTISRTSILAEIIEADSIIPEWKLEYFRERQKSRLYDFILNIFIRKEKTAQFTKADLARRINKEPAQITRWLSNPSNWTLDTISDLMLGICGAELKFSVSAFSTKPLQTSTQVRTEVRINYQGGEKLYHRLNTTSVSDSYGTRGEYSVIN